MVVVVVGGLFMDECIFSVMPYWPVLYNWIHTVRSCKQIQRRFKCVSVQLLPLSLELTASARDITQVWCRPLVRSKLIQPSAIPLWVRISDAEHIDWFPLLMCPSVFTSLYWTSPHLRLWQEDQNRTWWEECGISVTSVMKRTTSTGQ